MTDSSLKNASAIVVGGGPAGLMAADVLSRHGVQVDLFDAMPSVGRKFLLAGRGGLNLTHSEALPQFIGRYSDGQTQLRPLLESFTPEHVRQWAKDLGIDTFVGTSGRVFPTDMKAAPLLRAWLHRMRRQGVRFHMRHRWTGWADDGALQFTGPHGEVSHKADAVVMALGGGSWSRLGSDGAWLPLLQTKGVESSPLKAANCGFDVEGGWTDHLKTKFAGQPIKPVAIAFKHPNGEVDRQQGEFVLTETGVEGSLVYAFSNRIRKAIDTEGHATIELDLLPSHSADKVLTETTRPKGPRSLSTHLKSCLGLHGIKMGLLYELLPAETLANPKDLAQAIKALPIRLVKASPMDEAISTAGGVRWDTLDEHLMVKASPGLFMAGEMLDWDAPTGGYLLTACLATGQHAAQGALTWFRANSD